MKPRIVAALLIGVFLLAMGALSAAQPPQPFVVNADFEQGFTMRDNAPEVYVAIGWDYSALPTDRWCPSPCKRPEFKGESGIVHSGDFSQRWFATFARQFGTIHQSVAVEAGQWYEFSCYVYAISEPDGQQAAFVGINPWNGGVFERTMVWGQQQPWGSYRQWHRVSVTAQAWGDRIRVAVGANNNWPTKNNAAYVDNCTIRVVEQSASPTPCPTCIPGGNCATVQDVQTVIQTVVAGREPVKWPR